MCLIVTRGTTADCTRTACRQAVAMEAGDGDFPRGGGSEPSALEYRTIAAQAARDADTEVCSIYTVRLFSFRKRSEPIAARVDRCGRISTAAKCWVNIIWHDQ